MQEVKNAAICWEKRNNHEFNGVLERKSVGKHKKKKKGLQNKIPDTFLTRLLKGINIKRIQRPLKNSGLVCLLHYVTSWLQLRDG